MLPAVRPCSSATALSRSRSSVETLMVVAAMPEVYARYTGLTRA